MKRMFAASEFEEYLQPTQFIDSDSPQIVAFAQAVVGDAKTDIEKAVNLYYAVRDRIRYNPYVIDFDPATYKASWPLQTGEGFCIQKAILLAAVARVEGIPSRLGFADVRNHLATERLIALMRTDEFIYHGYTELYLNGKWVKATPAFNLSLCQKFDVKPLEFNGTEDSIFHPFDISGNMHMEYIRDHGQFADFPLEKMIQAFEEGYPHLFKDGGPGWPAKGNFEREKIVNSG
jgi:transglutaminase-like putative cysteine protease